MVDSVTDFITVYLGQTLCLMLFCTDRLYSICIRVYPYIVCIVYALCNYANN